MILEVFVLPICYFTSAVKSEASTVANTVALTVASVPVTSPSTDVTSLSSDQPDTLAGNSTNVFYGAHRTL